ncbi:MAG: hypothetical protein ACYDC1_13420 [Limisphaerales bacterium]
MKRILLASLLAFLPPTATPAGAPSSAELSAALETIRAVGLEGRGNEAAGVAWKRVAMVDAASLPVLLQAMDGASDLALNWLRAGVDAVATREIASGRPLPLAALETFLRDRSHHPRARRLAFELIQAARPEAARSLLDGMLDDPGSELRREAVQERVARAARDRASGRNDEAVAALETALKAARDVDQIEAVAAQLKELGRPVDLPRVFGWVSEWKVVGPFDNTAKAGFDRSFPPEQGVDLAAEYDGKNGRVRWQDLRAAGDYGWVDLNQPCGALKEVTGYAFAALEAPAAGAAELRLGCKNAWKIWWNGQFVFGRDEYHRGAEIDQYRFPIELQAGRNTILVKVCQNEQTEDWTKEWEFQLRVTDPLGAPLSPLSSAKP